VVVHFYNQPGTAAQWIKEGKTAPIGSGSPVTASAPTRSACPWGLSPTTRVISCAGSSCRSLRSWSLPSLQQRLFKTGGRLIRLARYFILQLAENQLTQCPLAQIIRRIERLAWHPT
jgi:hypothetical protein